MKRDPLTATPHACNLLAIGMTADTQAGLFKRAALLRTGLIDVAIAGKDAALAQPKIKDQPRRKRRTLKQIALTEKATFRAKQAAHARRQADRVPA